jgi:amino acid transporter
MEATTRPAEGRLRRAIGRNMLLVFVLGDVLGAGIYALVGEVGGRTGGAIWTAFAVALALAVFTAFAYAELVTKYPRAAGAALYTNKAFRRPFLTFMVAFAVMASGITSASTLARAFGGDYLSVFVDVPTVVAALAFIVGVALVNVRGIRESIRLNLGLTAIEVLGLLLVVVIAVAALADGTGDTGRAFEFKEGESVIGAMLGGAALAFYALIGFEDSVNVAEETEDPQRDYPRALFGGLLVAGVIYLLVSGLAAMVVPVDRLAGSSGPLLEVTGTGPLAVDDKVFAAIALFAVANGALINMIMASRLTYGLARQGLAPAALGRVHATRHTPYVAIAFTTVLAAVLICTGDLSDLADTTVLLLLAVFVLVNAAVLVLRRDRVPHAHFRTPAAMPVVGLVVCIVLMTEKEPEIWLRAGLLLLVGVAFWVVDRIVAGRRHGDFDTAEMEALERPDAEG